MTEPHVGRSRKARAARPAPKQKKLAPPEPRLRARTQAIIDTVTTHPTESASKIAARVGNGCTRSAVIGVMHRHRLKKQAAAPLAMDWEDELHIVTVGGCAFIFGDVVVPQPDGRRIPGRWRYCNGKAQAGSSYCPDHHKLCWHRAPSPQPPGLLKPRSAA